MSFESHAYINLGFRDYKELGPSEIVYVTPEKVEVLSEAREEMKICSFLWVYYGYPTSSYEGVNVEEMRYKCGSMLAKRDGDSVKPDIVAGVDVYKRQVVVCDTVTADGEVVTTAQVKEAFDKSDFDKIYDLCGHPYIMIGEVEHGKALGRTVGMPTADVYKRQG